MPTLRFPEFQNDKGWNAGLLGNNRVSKFVKNRVALDQLRLDTYVSTENLLPDYAGISKASKLPPSGSFTQYKKGDVLISNIRPYLKKVWQADREGASSNDVIVIRSGETISNELLIHILKNDSFISYVMKGAKGVKMPRGDIPSIKEYPVAFPEFNEQQKVADCLTSLDVLVTTQAEKLDALKAHKKGLMQRLFPAEGKTLPKRRFPEFRDTGEWSMKTLEQVAGYVNGKAHEQDIDELGKYIVVNSKFISTEGEVKKFSNVANLLAKKNDILMVLSDIPNGRAVAKCFHVDQDNVYTVNQRICKLTAKNSVSVVLFYILDRNAYFLAFDDGVKQTNLRKNDVLNCPVLLPKDEVEQQKIADCLVSIDDLIVAQSQKIEVLKAYKKGLMQQLFPSMDEESV